MANKIHYIIAFWGLFVFASVSAQDSIPKNWNVEQIRGTRHVPYPPAEGRPYLFDKFTPGAIKMLSGNVISDLQLRYSSYRDELIYYDPEIPAQIIVDKISLKGFNIADPQGDRHEFRQQYYSGFNPGNRFFEVLEDGGVSLLAYRKVVLELCAPYNDITGKINNVAYQEACNYYLYDPSMGYESIRINRSSLLSKFSKADQKQVRRLLRKNEVKISDEYSFVRAWRLIREKKLEFTCNFNNSNTAK